MTDPLQRFREPVALRRTDAEAELSRGRKETHWMWFMFPQLRALGRSTTAQHFGLEDLNEARLFLRDEELGAVYESLVEIVHRVVADGHRISDVFGSPDDVKLVSSLTLFQAAARLESRPHLADRCGEILEAAERQGLPRCTVSTSAIAGR